MTTKATATFTSTTQQKDLLKDITALRAAVNKSKRSVSECEYNSLRKQICDLIHFFETYSLGEFEPVTDEITHIFASQIARGSPLTNSDETVTLSEDLETYIRRVSGLDGDVLEFCDVDILDKTFKCLTHGKLVRNKVTNVGHVIINDRWEETYHRRACTFDIDKNKNLNEQFEFRIMIDGFDQLYVVNRDVDQVTSETTVSPGMSVLQDFVTLADNMIQGHVEPIAVADHVVQTLHDYGYSTAITTVVKGFYTVILKNVDDMWFTLGIDESPTHGINGAFSSSEEAMNFILTSITNCN